MNPGLPAADPVKVLQQERHYSAFITTLVSVAGLGPLGKKTPRAIHPSLARSKIACAICLLRRGGAGNSIRRAAPVSWASKCASPSLLGQKKKGEEKKTTSAAAAAATKQLPVAGGTRQFRVHIFVRAHIHPLNAQSTEHAPFVLPKVKRELGVLTRWCPWQWKGPNAPHLFRPSLKGL